MTKTTAFLRGSRAAMLLVAACGTSIHAAEDREPTWRFRREALFSFDIPADWMELTSGLETFDAGFVKGPGSFIRPPYLLVMVTSKPLPARDVYERYTAGKELLASWEQLPVLAGERWPQVESRGVQVEPDFYHRPSDTFVTLIANEGVEGIEASVLVKKFHARGSVALHFYFRDHACIDARAMATVLDGFTFDAPFAYMEHRARPAAAPDEGSSGAGSLPELLRMTEDLKPGDAGGYVRLLRPNDRPLLALGAAALAHARIREASDTAADAELRAVLEKHVGKDALPAVVELLEKGGSQERRERGAKLFESTDHAAFLAALLRLMESHDGFADELRLRGGTAERLQVFGDTARVRMNGYTVLTAKVGGRWYLTLAP